LFRTEIALPSFGSGLEISSEFAQLHCRLLSVNSGEDTSATIAKRRVQSSGVIRSFGAGLVFRIFKSLDIFGTHLPP
jgi:hypothetical protein